MFLNVISWLKDYPSLLLSIFGSPGRCFLLGCGALGRSVLIDPFACSLSTFSGKSFPGLALLLLLHVLLLFLDCPCGCMHASMCVLCLCVFVCALNISMIHVRSRTLTQQTRCSSQRERKKARVKSQRVSRAVKKPHPIPDYRSPMFASPSLPVCSSGVDESKTRA
jgi:hypothetical protein